MTNTDPVRWEPPSMKSILQLDGNPLVSCVCGRRANADMMRSWNDGFACDACFETLFRTGQLTAEAFALSNGAPDAVLEKARSQDIARTDGGLTYVAARGFGLEA